MLTVGAGVALGSVAPAITTPAVASTVTDQAAEPAPRTLSTSRMVRNGSLRVRQTKFPLTHLGVSWRGGRAYVRLRTAAGWSGWQMLEACGGGPDRRGRPNRNTVVAAAGAIGYDVAVSGGGNARVTELNTVDGPPLQSATTLTLPAPPSSLATLASYGVPYLSRAAWGANESLRFVNGVEVWPAEYYPPQLFTVHHSGFTANDSDPAATVRAIYQNQAVGEAWGDIGYHLLIDGAGRVYEGRWSGTDGMPAFGADWPLVMSTGAHALGYNTGNIGVCLLGLFDTSNTPTAAALQSLVRVLAWLAHSCGLDPLGTTRYFNPVNGNTRNVADIISGHRDWAPTACPGSVYGQLATVRSAVAQERRRPGWRPPIPRPPSG